MSVLESIIGVIAPPICIYCEKEGSVLCPACRPRLVLLPSRCFLCSKLTDEYKTCDSCRRKTKLKHVWVAVDYDDLTQHLVKTYKFDHDRAVAEVLAELMAGALPAAMNGYELVPIPSATSRVRKRGFDHAVLLAKKLNRQLGLPCHTALRRVGQTRQVGAKRTARLAQLEGSYRVRSPKAIQGKKIVLVDDIVTTGSTLSTAAAELRRAGAREVSAVVFAKKQ